ncbi:hypothetical protein [Gimesia panareensis]|uniref:hypothetical protein n=1 Tax=Gimesia panareensis TaxID=2527978 RepID=UPI00118D29EC|nr:hypothetical protein [Gimesia panareensis]QDU50277.1 hypothetical protein Pan110_26220 [Gimesia panareensis]
MERSERISGCDETQGLPSRDQTFLVNLEPINEHITTDDLLRKLRLVAGGCGIRINSAQLASPQLGHQAK